MLQTPTLKCEGGLRGLRRSEGACERGGGDEPNREKQTRSLVSLA